METEARTLLEHFEGLEDPCAPIAAPWRAVADGGTAIYAPKLCKEPLATSWGLAFR